MKRAGNLWESVLAWDNLREAFRKAARGKRYKGEVCRFREDLDARIGGLRRELSKGTFPVGNFHTFIVHEPKRRVIHAAHFPERVVHHALMNVCEPVFERQLVHHTYACRKGKGRLKAIAQARAAMRRNNWYLKLDIRKYFESIDHAVLLAHLRRILKDPDVLGLFARIIGSHEQAYARGLPIGSLTSQHLANLYLGSLDRFCQNLPGVRAYVRYMDDFVCWAADKHSLIEAGRRIEAHVREQLRLELKHPPAPQPAAIGMNFLGYRVYPDHVRLNRASKVRYRRKVTTVANLYGSGQLTEADAQQRLTAFTQPARAWQFRQRTHAAIWSAAIGHEPGEPGRLVEQQRHQRARVEPQQQQPGQPQQQHRLPPCPQLRPHPAGRSDLATSMGLNRLLPGS